MSMAVTPSGVQSQSEQNGLLAAILLTLLATNPGITPQQVDTLKAVDLFNKGSLVANNTP